MAKYQSPGIYINEIPQSSLSISLLETAFPVFLGFTEKLVFQGENILQIPYLIQSMREFEEVFGGDFTPELDATQIFSENSHSEEFFYLYKSMHLFFANGGVKAYVISIGNYAMEVHPEAFLEGILVSQKLEEVTLIAFPDAVKLSDEEMGRVQNHALEACKEAGNRFCVLDTKVNLSLNEGWATVQQFRKQIGPQNLEFGAAYMPWLVAKLEVEVTAISIRGIFPQLYEQDSILLENIYQGKSIREWIQSYESFLREFQLAQQNSVFADVFPQFEREKEEYISGVKMDLNPFDSTQFFRAILRYDSNSDDWNQVWKDAILVPILIWQNEYQALLEIEDESEQKEKKFNFLDELIQSEFFQKLKEFPFYLKDVSQPIQMKFERILKDIFPFYVELIRRYQRKLQEVPPSGAILGIYVSVDDTRGVWKAAANVSVEGIQNLTYYFNANEMDQLVVDPYEGKSINPIRKISDSNFLVWGARTLAGNNVEFRYIPVQRLILSIKKDVIESMDWIHREVNDSTLWLKIRTEIENYLFNLWKNGGLAGSQPEEAYFVHCNLNISMTMQDLTEGRLIVQMGVAPLRPAEFLIIRLEFQVNSPVGD